MCVHYSNVLYFRLPCSFYLVSISRNRCWHIATAILSVYGIILNMSKPGFLFLSVELATNNGIMWNANLVSQIERYGQQIKWNTAGWNDVRWYCSIRVAVVLMHKRLFHFLYSYMNDAHFWLFPAPRLSACRAVARFDCCFKMAENHCYVTGASSHVILDMNMIDSEKQLCYENFIYIALGLSPSQALTNGRLLGLHGWVTCFIPNVWFEIVISVMLRWFHICHSPLTRITN